MTAKVLVTCRQMQVELPTHQATLEHSGLEVVAPVLAGQHLSAAELAPLGSGVVAMIAGDDELNHEFFDAFPDLRVLVRWGIGMDSVDFEAAVEHGVVVRNTPGVFGEEVADAAFGYILNLARRHHAIDRDVRTGAWPKFEGVSLSGETLGVVGLGSIGRAVSRRAHGFGMTVLAHDPFIDKSISDVPLVELQALLANSRFVVLTCPLAPETHHLMSAERLAQMRSDAFLVNVARGPVVDEDALADALAGRSIAGAGLDVFEVEPLPSESPLRGFDNVILGAHNGSNARAGVVRASARAVAVLLEELRGDS